MTKRCYGRVVLIFAYNMWSEAGDGGQPSRFDSVIKCRQGWAAKTPVRVRNEGSVSEVGYSHHAYRSG